MSSELTPKQTTILQEVIKGKFLKEVALELGTTEEAMRIEMFRARQRAGVETLYQLIAVSVSLGWVDPPERKPRVIDPPMNFHNE